MTVSLGLAAIVAAAVILIVVLSNLAATAITKQPLAALEALITQLSGVSTKMTDVLADLTNAVNSLTTSQASNQAAWLALVAASQKIEADFATLVNELSTTGINTSELSTDVEGLQALIAQQSAAASQIAATTAAIQAADVLPTATAPASGS